MKCTSQKKPFCELLQTSSDLQITAWETMFQKLSWNSSLSVCILFLQETSKQWNKHAGTSSQTIREECLQTTKQSGSIRFWIFVESLRNDLILKNLSLLLPQHDSSTKGSWQTLSPLNNSDIKTNNDISMQCSDRNPVRLCQGNLRTPDVVAAALSKSSLSFL